MALGEDFSVNDKAKDGRCHRNEDYVSEHDRSPQREPSSSDIFTFPAASGNSARTFWRQQAWSSLPSTFAQGPRQASLLENREEHAV
jgi:hypothetical protein